MFPLKKSQDQQLHNTDDFIFFLKSQRNNASDIICTLLAEKKYLEEYVRELENKLEQKEKLDGDV